MDPVQITRTLAQLPAVAVWPFTSLADRLVSRLRRSRSASPDQPATFTPDEAAAAQPWAAAVAEPASVSAEVPGPAWAPAEPAMAEEPPVLPPCEPTVPTVPVTFSLPGEVGAGDVALCGEFNGWDTGPIPLIRDTDGPWQVTVPLAPGSSYRYRYLLDGERWENAWNADRYEPNPFGSDDSVVIVDWPELTLQAV